MARPLKISGLRPCNGLNIADNEAQWIVHFSDDKGLGISNAVRMGSPVIIKLFTKKVNKQVHEKNRNFQLE